MKDMHKQPDIQLWGERDDDPDVLRYLTGNLNITHLPDALIQKYWGTYCYLELRQNGQKLDCWGSSPAYTAERIFCAGNGAT